MRLLQVCITWPILFVEACKKWTKILITKLAPFHTLVNRAEKLPITIFPGACIYTETNFFLNFLFNKTIFFDSSAPAKYRMVKLLICFYLSFPHLKCLHIFQMWIPKLVGGLQTLEAITCTETRCYYKYTHMYNHRTVEWLGLVWSNCLR